MQKFTDTILDLAGNAQENVAVAIYQAGTSTLAAIYQDDGVTTKTNPLGSNELGFVSAKIPNGTYDILYGATTRINGKVFFDPADPTSLVITSGTIDGVTIGGTTPPDATFNDVLVNGEFNN